MVAIALTIIILQYTTTLTLTILIYTQTSNTRIQPPLAHKQQLTASIKQQYNLTVIDGTASVQTFHESSLTMIQTKQNMTLLFSAQTNTLIIITTSDKVALRRFVSDCIVCQVNASCIFENTSNLTITLSGNQMLQIHIPQFTPCIQTDDAYLMGIKLAEIMPIIKYM